MKNISRQELNAMLANIAIYEQAKEFLEAKGNKPSQWFEERLAWMYENCKKPLIKFLRKDLKK